MVKKLPPALNLVVKSTRNCKIRFWDKTYCLIEDDNTSNLAMS